jgi:integrase/recombinase XerD
MDWKTAISAYKSYLLLERSLSENSVESYLRDVEKLAKFSIELLQISNVSKIFLEQLQDFLQHTNKIGLSDRSQARLVSGLRSFYKFLLLENVVQDDPTELLESPKLSRKIPDFLTLDEINAVLASIDLSHPQGQRNRAILETLYSCGLRVSELLDLKISNYFPELGYLRVIGKGNKERIVPIGSEAIKYNGIYMSSIRNHLPIKEGFQDFIFLNRRGRKLSRVMIFHIVKQAVLDAGIDKIVSPHTFRHSFATHLVEGGADLKSIQDMLGHESITTTEIYTHLDTQYLKDTILLYHPRHSRVI